MVVSLGGGTVQSLEMLNKLKKEGCLIYLKASEEIIKKRLNGTLNSRPLLKDLSNKDLDIFDRLVFNKINWDWEGFLISENIIKSIIKCKKFRSTKYGIKTYWWRFVS